MLFNYTRLYLEKIRINYAILIRKPINIILSYLCEIYLYKIYFNFISEILNNY